MPVTLMVHVMPGGQAAPLLQLAQDVAAKVDARKVIGIAALHPLQIYAGPDAYVPQDLFQQDWEAMEKELAAAEKQFRIAFADKAVTLEWRSIITTGVASDYVAGQMRAADLLITQPTPQGGLFDPNRHMNVADLVLRAGTSGPGRGAGCDEARSRQCHDWLERQPGSPARRRRRHPAASDGGEGHRDRGGRRR